MKKLFITALLLSLTGCATTGTEMQAECEAKYREFPDIFQCTYDAVVTRNSRILQDARAKLYLLRGEQLSLAVVRQQMSSLDARVEWQQLYIKLKNQKDQEVASSMLAISQALEAARIQQPPPPARAIAPNAAVSCVSTKIGATVYTNCR